MAKQLVSVDRQERIRSIAGRAKDDDGGGWPFHEVLWFETIDAGIAWTADARANPAQYRYIKLDVEFDVRETSLYSDGTQQEAYYQRGECLFEYNANVASDEEIYWRLKGYGQLLQDQWAVIRNGEMVARTDNEAEAWLVASRSTSRALVRHVGCESPQDERSIAYIVQRNAQIQRTLMQ